MFKQLAGRLSDHLHTKLSRTSLLGGMWFNRDYRRDYRREVRAGVVPQVANERAFRRTLRRWPRA